MFIGCEQNVHKTCIDNVKDACSGKKSTTGPVVKEIKRRPTSGLFNKASQAKYNSSLGISKTHYYSILVIANGRLLIKCCFALFVYLDLVQCRLFFVLSFVYFLLYISCEVKVCTFVAKSSELLFCCMLELLLSLIFFVL